MQNTRMTAHRPPSEGEDPEPGMLPIDPDDGVTNPWTPGEDEGDQPVDPAP